MSGASAARTRLPSDPVGTTRRPPGPACCQEHLDAATGEYQDLIKAGIIDPAEVTRSALQNAASIAALFLTTEPLIPD